MCSHRSVITSPQGEALWVPHCTPPGGAVPTARSVPWSLELPLLTHFFTSWPQAFSALGPAQQPSGALPRPPAPGLWHLEPKFSLTVGWTLCGRSARLEFFPGEAPSTAQ